LVFWTFTLRKEREKIEEFVAEHTWTYGNLGTRDPKNYVTRG
jgi:hypothetical protein